MPSGSGPVALLERVTGLTPMLEVGRFDGLPRIVAFVGQVMVCVRFLRTQQRVKNRCQLPRLEAWLAIFLVVGLVLGELSFG